MSLNKVMLIGNVGNDPEVRYLNDAQQTKTARLRLATTERFTDRNGETRENTEWHTVTTYRRTADVIEKFVKKGTQIYVEGKLQTREWTDNAGNKRTTTEVIADNIQLLGKRTDNPGGAPAEARPATSYASVPSAPAAPATPAAPAVDTGFEAPTANDDLPF